MTELLERAFAEASKLSPAEQELLASRLLAELSAEDDFDKKIAGWVGKLEGLAAEALAEHRAGLTEELDPEGLRTRGPSGVAHDGLRGGGPAILS